MRVIKFDEPRQDGQDRWRIETAIDDLRDVGGPRGEFPRSWYCPVDCDALSIRDGDAPGHFKVVQTARGNWGSSWDRDNNSVLREDRIVAEGTVDSVLGEIQSWQIDTETNLADEAMMKERAAKVGLTLVGEPSMPGHYAVRDRHGNAWVACDMMAGVEGQVELHENAARQGYTLEASDSDHVVVRNRNGGVARQGCYEEIEAFVNQRRPQGAPFGTIASVTDGFERDKSPDAPPRIGYKR